jgi:hypothetical protein
MHEYLWRLVMNQSAEACRSPGAQMRPADFGDTARAASHKTFPPMLDSSQAVKHLDFASDVIIFSFVIVFVYEVLR